MNLVSKTVTRFRNRCVLAIVLMFASNAIIEADSPHSEIRQAIRSVQTTIAFAEAELDLESYYLNQIKRLRQNGHASWLELAQQQAVVQSLTAQRSEIKQYLEFLEGVATQVNIVSNSVNEAPNSDAWTIHVPGSKRILGWIESDQQSVIGELANVESRRSEEQTQIEQARSELVNGAVVVRQMELRLADKALVDGLPIHWQDQL